MLPDLQLIGSMCLLQKCNEFSHRELWFCVNPFSAPAWVKRPSFRSCEQFLNLFLNLQTQKGSSGTKESCVKKTVIFNSSNKILTAALNQGVQTSRKDPRRWYILHSSCRKTPKINEASSFFLEPTSGQTERKLP